LQENSEEKDGKFTGKLKKKCSTKNRKCSRKIERKFHSKKLAYSFNDLTNKLEKILRKYQSIKHENRKGKKSLIICLFSCFLSFIVSRIIERFFSFLLDRYSCDFDLLLEILIVIKIFEGLIEYFFFVELGD
jgi:hypothetical protein